MRRKLAVLESVALLPPHQQIQALSMLVRPERWKGTAKLVGLFGAIAISLAGGQG